MINELFEIIVLGYCTSEQKEWNDDFTEKEKMKFWNDYIYPFFSSENANIFLNEWI